MLRGRQSGEPFLDSWFLNSRAARKSFPEVVRRSGGRYHHALVDAFVVGFFGSEADALVCGVLSQVFRAWLNWSAKAQSLYHIPSLGLL